MKTIVIDGRMWGWTGIGRYTRELVANLQKIDTKNKYIILMQSADATNWEPNAKNFRVKIADIKPYSFAEQLKFPGVLGQARPDLVHFVSPNVPIFYRAPHVTTIHDLTLVDYNTSRRSSVLWGAKRMAFKLVMDAAAKLSNHVITPTNFIRQQIIERYGVDEKNITATHEGVKAPNERLKMKDEKLIEGEYLLYVGNFYPYKNLGKLIDAMIDVITINPHIKLVLAGKKDYFAEQLAEQVAVNGLENHVVFTGYVDDEDLAKLYRHAKLYVFPSISEGFGLPPLEAMSYGVPVVAADASCLPEVLGDAVVFFDPLSTDDIASTVTSLLANDKERKRLGDAGKKHVGNFSWKKMSQETLDIYNSVLDEKSEI